MNERETGIVKWFHDRKLYGFIRCDKGGDVFVHYNENRGEGFRWVFVGPRGVLKVIEGLKGPQAKDVSVIDM